MSQGVMAIATQPPAAASSSAACTSCGRLRIACVCLLPAPGIDIFVPGLPQTKGSAKGFGFIHKKGPRAGKIGVSVTNDNQKAKPWAALISTMAQDAMRGRAPLEGPVSVAITFYLPRPKSHFGKKGLKPSAPARPAVKPDGDKMMRCAWDALTAIVFVDDAQIVEWPGGKRYAIDGRVGARIVVTAVSP